MRIVLALVCLVVVALAEDCGDGTDTTRCANEICATNFVPTCEQGICTCNAIPTQAPSGCQSVADCDATNYWSSHHCNKHSRDCRDTKCVCVHGNHVVG